MVRWLPVALLRRQISETENSRGVGTNHLVEEQNARERSKALLIRSISIGFMDPVRHKSTDWRSVPSDPCPEVIETGPFACHIYDQL